MGNIHKDIKERNMKIDTCVNDNLFIRKVLLLFMLFFFFAIIVSNSVLAASSGESYKPYIHKPSVGQYPRLEMYGSYQTQLFPGSATYRYKIIVPPGINGLEPELFIEHNSQTIFNNPSVMGAGWSITSNYILRHVNFTVSNSSDDYFIINLNGYSDKIFYKNGTFKTFIDTYLKVENKSSGGIQYWLVTTKDGTKYKFGSASNSLLQSNSSNYTLKWFLDSIEEIHGNTVNYSYTKNPYSGDFGAMYLSNITYNKDLLRKITFQYENSIRLDKRLVYEQGSKFLESRRLRGIEIYFNNSIVRRYSFTYLDLNSEKTMSALSNITYIGADNVSVLHNVSFEYYDSQAGFANSTRWLVPEEFTSIDSGSQDFGLRLVDVNNDGFMDLVKSNATSNYTKLNDKNSSWNLTSMFSIPEQIVDSSNVFQGVLFADVNKDGLVDILKAKNGTTRKTYLNNGTAWKNDSNTTWNIPVDFINSSSGDEGSRLLELNGDGLIDIVQGKALGSVNKSWLNNGTGWTNTSLWRLPEYFIANDGNDTGLRELDLNGDGLTDLLKDGEPGSAWLNNGTGWTNDSGYRPNLNFTGNAYPDLGVRFMDINGDNLPDILQNFFSNVSFLNQTCYDQTNSTQNCTLYNVTVLTNVKINNGSGWVLGASWQSPESFTYNGFNTGRRIADVNGDGYSDIVVGFKNVTFERRTQIRNASNAYFLKKIKNEYGGTTSVSYNKSTLMNNGQSLGFNIWIVNDALLNNSLNSSFAIAAKTSYRYFGGKFDYPNSEFLGFSQVNETFPDSSIISHFYHQDSILKGKEFLTKIFDKNNRRLKETFNKYTNSTDNKIYLNTTTEYLYEGNPTAVRINTSYSYDGFGNVIFINYSGNVGVSGDEKYESYVYIYNNTAYIVDKVSNYSLQNSTFSLLKRTWFYYDNFVNRVTKGDVTQIVQYHDRGQNPEKNYTYDSFGNAIREVDARANELNYTYDAETNTFVTRKTNALGHRINYGYDKGTGNILFEEKDGISRNYTYDTFGRISREFITPDNLTSPTKWTTYEFDGKSPEKTVVETKNNDTFYSESIYFYDGFSNPVQIKSKYAPNGQIVQNYIYDGKFRIVEEQTPYIQNYSTQINLTSSSFNIRYGYDAFDRVTNITKKDNNLSRIIFNNTKIVSINELGIQKEYFIDAYSRIVNIYEHNRNSSGTDEIYNTSYYYDSTNNLLRIVDAQNNSFLFEYDSLGRRISLDDPNMEKWTYTYDPNGNLINQTDGRNITTSFTYDKLNRISFKSANNSNISFVYDSQFNGTLTNITSDSDYFNFVYHKYTYDNRSRVIKEEVFICYREVNPGDDECDWLNVSVDYDSSDKVLNMYMPYVNLSHKYNSLGKLEKIQNFLDSVNYNAFGKVKNKTYSNGLLTNYNYDIQNRLNQITTGNGNIQNLTYIYDAVGNVKSINDSKNKLFYSMVYDDLDRLIKTIIYNFRTFEHEKFIFNYNKIGGIVSTITDLLDMNYSYNVSLVHAPVNITIYNRSISRIEINLIDPIGNKSVTRNSFFNFTVQTCCRDNDCWGINVSLDPEENLSFTIDNQTLNTNLTLEENITTENKNNNTNNEKIEILPIPENNISAIIDNSSITNIDKAENIAVIPFDSDTIKHTYSPNTETICKEGVCTTILYSESRFVYENNIWKKIEEANSLKSVWGIQFEEDPNFPIKIIDYNYTSIVINLSVSEEKIGRDIPLKVYNRYNKIELPKDSLGNEVNKDKIIRIERSGEEQNVIVDLSDTIENLLTQEIKWGDNSTITTVYDNNSINVDDAYIRDAGFSGNNFGSDSYLLVQNSTTSNEAVLIKFNISQIPRQALVDEAKLFLYLETNNLDAGESYNVSVHWINHSYQWDEDTVTWDNGPQPGNYSPSYLDKVLILNTDLAKYISWNVTSIIQKKNKNESFYLKAIENIGGTSADYIRFRSKEHTSLKPYLNVTYRLKNLISNIVGETPFYTTVTNPYYIDLEQNVCQNITWAVNATGNIGSYIFFAYANKTTDGSIYNYTDLVDINIV